MINTGLKERVYLKEPRGKFKVDQDILLKGSEWTSILKTIPIKAILNDRRVNDAMVVRDKHRQQLIENTALGRVGISWGLFVGLVHPLVINKLKGVSRGNGLKGYSPLQIHLILSAWTSYKINKGLFKISQLPKYKNFRYSVVKNEISNFHKLGLIEVLTEQQIENLTNKVISPKFSRKPNYYKFTRNGEKIILEYLLIYKQVHEQITENFWIDDLETLSKEF